MANGAGNWRANKGCSQLFGWIVQEENKLGINLHVLKLKDYFYTWSQVKQVPELFFSLRYTKKMFSDHDFKMNVNGDTSSGNKHTYFKCIFKTLPGEFSFNMAQTNL